MYKNSLTEIQTRDGCTDYYRIDVGLHQGSALSPLLFIIIMDVLASEPGSKPPESMLFADELVLCETSREKDEQELEMWRDQFEIHGLRISRTKTEHHAPYLSMWTIALYLMFVITLVWLFYKSLPIL